MTMFKILNRFVRNYLQNHWAFYLKLDNEDTSDEDYEHAQNVWALSKHKTIKDYNDLYLQSDVLICYLLMYLRILEKVVPHISWIGLGCMS